MPDLILLDVMFPENSTAGFDSAKEIRENDTLKNIPISIIFAIN